MSKVQPLDRLVLPDPRYQCYHGIVEAVVMEIQRYANIVPQGVQHVVQKEVTVNGLTLPTGAMVMPLMKELLQGSYWEDGETFRPERFLDSDGKCGKDDHLIPFSIGELNILPT